MGYYVSASLDCVVCDCIRCGVALSFSSINPHASHRIFFFFFEEKEKEHDCVWKSVSNLVSRFPKQFPTFLGSKCNWKKLKIITSTLNKKQG